MSDCDVTQMDEMLSRPEAIMVGVDHEYTMEIVCPYCGYEYGDSWEELFNGSEPKQMECASCYKTFVAERIFTVEYSTAKLEADYERIAEDLH